VHPVDSGEVRNKIESLRDRDDLELQHCSTLSFYTAETEFWHIVSFLSFGHRSIHQFAEDEAALGTLSRIAGHHFDHHLAWLYFLVELSRYSPNILDFTHVFRCASELLNDFKEHIFLDISHEDENLACGIQKCLEAFDIIGQNIETSFHTSHWTSGRLANAENSDERLRRRIPRDSGCGSFVSYLLCLALPDLVISPILTRQYASLTDLQKQFALETALIPHIYGDSVVLNSWYLRPDLCTLGCPTHYGDIIVYLIGSGMDVNRATQRIGRYQDYSVWQFYLLWLHDYFHQHPELNEPYPGEVDHGQCDPEHGAKWIRDTTEIFRAFVQHGADPFAMISREDLITFHEPDATVNKPMFLSVADVVDYARAAAEWQLEIYDDPHWWLASRFAVASELQKLLQEAYAQGYRERSHATALRATAQSNR
jgi:hypothetical protein